MGEDYVRIFDTTLRRGAIGRDQPEHCRKTADCPQPCPNEYRRHRGGFPGRLTGDLQAVQEIARNIKGPGVIAGLARTRTGDIEAAWEALKDAERPRIHTFIATSDIHMEHKLRMSREQVKEEVRRAVSLPGVLSTTGIFRRRRQPFRPGFSLGRVSSA